MINKRILSLFLAISLMLPTSVSCREAWSMRDWISGLVNIEQKTAEKLAPALLFAGIAVGFIYYWFYKKSITPPKDVTNKPVEPTTPVVEEPTQISLEQAKELFKDMRLFMEVPYQRPSDPEPTGNQKIWFKIEKIEKLNEAQRGLAAQLKNNRTSDAIKLGEHNIKNPGYAQFIINGSELSIDTIKRLGRSEEQIRITQNIVTKKFDNPQKHDVDQMSDCTDEFIHNLRQLSFPMAMTLERFFPRVINPIQNKYDGFRLKTIVFFDNEQRPK